VFVLQDSSNRGLIQLIVTACPPCLIFFWSLRTDRVRYFHVIFFSIILFRALSSSDVVEHAGSLAKQIKTETHMKASLYKYKDQFGKMLAREIYSLNLIPSSGERAWANSSKIENRNFNAQKINQVVRTCLNILWKCKLRLVGEYGIFEPEFGRSWEWHLGRGDLHKWMGNNTRAQL
jgi:hypothetical protein